MRQNYFSVVFAYSLFKGPSAIHSYVFLDETYVNYDTGYDPGEEGPFFVWC